MIRLFIITAIILLPFFSYGQRVYVTKHRHQADIAVYVSPNKCNNGISVYVTDKEYKCNPSKNIWYFTNKPYNAMKIYFVKYQSQANLSIFYRKNP